MRSFLAKLAQQTVPLVIVCFLMAGSAFAGSVITGSQVKDGSITGKDIKDESLSAADIKGSLKGGQGPRGEAGLAGEKGPQGADGPMGERGPTGPSGSSAEVETEEVAQSTPNNTEAFKELAVECPNGPVLSGGYVINPDTKEIRAVRNYAVASNEWLVRAINDGASSSWHLSVIAVCAK